MNAGPFFEKKDGGNTGSKRKGYHDGRKGKGG